MNKRPLIFVIALMLTLFVINQVFDWQSDKRRQELLSRMRERDKEELPKHSTELKKKVASIQDLPLAKLYADEQLTKPVSLAVQQSDDYLTFSWTNSLPQQLYVEGKKLALTSKNPNSGDLVIYSTRPNAQLVLASPPSNEPADLQLIYFTGNNLTPGVTVGVLEKGRFIGALEHPPANCIAVFEEGGKYLPYGIYRPDVLRFDPLAKNANLPNAVSMDDLEKKAIAKIAGEQFFVLENEYIQLVFSNVGASLSEINLPFRSKDNQSSIVQPIGFDHEMEADCPQNDNFPMYPYYKSGNNSLLQPKLGGYYPLLRRSIEGATKQQSNTIPPRYYALNLVSPNSLSDSSISNTLYKVKRLEKNLIQFELIDGTKKITKTYTLPSDPDSLPYSFELSLDFDGDIQGHELTSGIPEVELISDSFTPSIKYRPTGQKKNSVVQISLPKKLEAFDSTVPQWVSNANGFFGVIINPVQKQLGGFEAHYISGEEVPTRLTVIDPEYHLYPAEKYPGYELRLPLNLNTPNSKYRIFAGPYVKEIFEKVDAAYLDPSTGSNPEFESAISFHGWFSFISEPFAKFLFLLMKFFYFITGSWGFSIILLTIALRVMLYPLNTWSIRSTMKMQEIGPQVQALQARYKKDPKRAQMEIMHLYREKGVNPISGCFPLLIQLPFLIGMFDLLKSTFELRGTSFIPGWIDNLTAPDVLFSWNYPIFFIGNQFHLLPVLLGAVMYIQQRYSSSLAPASQATMTDQQRQQKFMGNIMTIVFTFMFYNFPSGLNIYWLSSMLLGILQQWFMMRKKRSKPVIEVLK